MKKYFITAFAFLAVAFGSKADDFSGTKPYDFSIKYSDGFELFFDWVNKEAKTCQFAAAKNPPELTFETITRSTVNNGENICDRIIKVWKFEGKGPNLLDYHLQNGFPETVVLEGDSITVVGVGDFSFANNGQSVKVEFPSSYIKIGKGAFFNSRAQLGSKPESFKQFTEIGDYAFYCESTNGAELPSQLTFSDNLTYLGKYAFANSSGIRNLEFGNGLIEISEGAFAGEANHIQNITISDSIEIIGDRAFEMSPELQNLKLGENVKRIGDYAFHACTQIRELIFPDSVEYIGSHAFCLSGDIPGPIIFGKNIREIGEKAFFFGRVGSQSEIHLPGTLEKIGPMAFGFNRTADTKDAFSDLYISAQTPPELWFDESTRYEGEEEGFTAFGKLDLEKVGDNYKNTNEYWIYPYVCLHVPYGTRDLYANAQGWKNFQCIVDDIMDESAVLNNLVGYAFIIPDETINLNDDILRQAGNDSTSWVWATDENGNPVTKWDKWEYSNEADKSIVSLDPKTNEVKGLCFGQAILVAKRHDDNKRIKDQYGYEDLSQDVIAAAVIVFVCPTITLVYENVPFVDGQQKAPAVYRSQEVDNAMQAENSFESLTEEYATYEHIVAYNSLPKLQIVSPDNIEIESLERGEMGEDKTVRGNLEDLFEELNDAQYQQDYIVPIDPISNNRVIKVNYAAAMDETPTSIETTFDSDVKVITKGNIITVEGAAEDDVLIISNLDGQIIFESKNKIAEIPGKGIYVGKVGETSFKIIVK